MSCYRRSRVAGACYFFVVTIADRDASTLLDGIADLLEAYRRRCRERPFTTDTIWTLPEGDGDYSTRRNLIKARFSHCRMRATTRSQSRQARREKGIWQCRYREHRIRDEADAVRRLPDSASRS